MADKGQPGNPRPPTRAATRRRVSRPGNEKMAPLAILGAINWSVRWYRPEGPQPPAEIAESFADFLIHGLTARRSAWKQRQKSTSR